MRLGIQKPKILNLPDEDVIYGEKHVFQFSNIKLDHYIPKTASGIFGRVICTNYKLVFIPNPQEKKPSD
jgi:hypothetical protein